MSSPRPGSEAAPASGAAGPSGGVKGRLWQLLPVDWGRVAEFTNEPVPAHIKRWWFALGGTPAYLFIIQATTGLLLAFYYVPDADKAYESVQAITFGIPFGWFIRSIHKWSANLMVATVLLHMLRVFFTGAYRRPRQLNWYVGLGLLGCTLAFGFTGYSLIYEQLSFWGATVAANLTATVPLIGEALATFLRGGPEVGANTLTRLYMLHVALLPIAMVVLIGLHIAVLRIHGISELSFEDPPGEPSIRRPGRRFGAKILAVFLGAGAVYAGCMAVLNTAPVDMISHEFSNAPMIPANMAPDHFSAGDLLGAITSARMIWAMFALVLAMGCYFLLRGHLFGLMIYLTTAVLGGAYLIFHGFQGPAAAVAVRAAILAVLIGGGIFCIARHRRFTEPPLEKPRFDFFPDHVLTEIIIGTLLLFGLTLLSLIFPAELGAKADPAMTPEHIKPEWYFFFQFRLLKLTSLDVSVILTGVLILLLLLWPLIDGLFEKIAPGRDLSVYAGVAGFLVFLSFTVWESMT